MSRGKTRPWGPRSSRAIVVCASACVLAVSAVFVVFGCEDILGIDGHDAHLASTTSPTLEAGVDAGATAAPCVLPSTGDATLRVGNLIADALRVDVCLTRTNGASPLDGKPVIASSGPTCPRGLGFKDVSAPFHIESGSYAIAFVTAGSSCASTPLATAQATIASGSGEGAYVLGDGTKAPAALALKELAPLQLASNLRFVHGIAGLGALDFGYVDTALLPATLQLPMFTDVAFGAVSNPPPDPNQPGEGDGYNGITLIGGTLLVGAAPTGTTAALIAGAPALTSRESYTAFAIGRLADPTFPDEIYVCDEMQNDGPLTRCANGGEIDVTVDVLDTYLWGPFSPFDTVRTDPIIAAVADLPSDIACIVDTFPESTEQRILAAAKAKFPYQVHFVDTLTTPIDDPAMQDGGLPPAPTAAPCAGEDGLLEPLLSCMRDNCTTELGSEDAGLVDDPATCLTNNCYGPSAGLVLTANQAKLKCWMCALLDFESDSTTANTRTECTTNVNAGFAFDGASDVIVLSRFPIGAAEQWVFGSTDWRASVVRVPITLPGPKPFDAYCTIVTDPVGGQTNPYTGNYGLGLPAADARGAENLLQLQKLVAYVTRKSAGLPAVVAGEFYAGPSAVGTTAYEPTSYAVLSAAFGFGAPPGAIPGCTFCGDNPITSPSGSIPAANSTLTTYSMLSNIPITDVSAASIELKGTVIDAGVPDAGSDAGAYGIPLSPYYDYRTTIRFRP
jgi:hypothetical protein